MTAPVSNAANPRLARPARAGIRSPTPPATSSAPTRYRSHWPAPMSANMSTMTGSPASFEIPPPAIIAASTTCRIQTPMLLARPGVCATVSELFLGMVLIRLSLSCPGLVPVMALAEWAGVSELISTKCSRERHLLLVAVEDHGDGTEGRDENYRRDEHPADFPGGHRTVHQAAYHGRQVGDRVDLDSHPWAT